MDAFVPPWGLKAYVCALSKRETSFASVAKCRFSYPVPLAFCALFRCVQCLYYGLKLRKPKGVSNHPIRYL